MPRNGTSAAGFSTRPARPERRSGASTRHRARSVAAMSVDDAHTRPPGTSDATVEALGKLSEALEVVEDARGDLYAFHRKCGMANLTLGEAVRLLRDAGH